MKVDSFSLIVIKKNTCFDIFYFIIILIHICIIFPWVTSKKYFDVADVLGVEIPGSGDKVRETILLSFTIYADRYS